jgi:hypothetical protein
MEIWSTMDMVEKLKAERMLDNPPPMGRSPRTPSRL